MNQKQREELLGILRARFERNTTRHQDILWVDVQKRLEANAEKLPVLLAMEQSGGEPDVVDFDNNSGAYIFCDCAAESPKDRRSVCYDREALESRKENKPTASAVDLAEAMGAELLTEAQYRELQTRGEFDTKTSSWLKTPAAIRKHGGALFGDRRYDHVFIYHNGAQSYYAARGFRCLVKV